MKPLSEGQAGQGPAQTSSTVSTAGRLGESAVTIARWARSVGTAVLAVARNDRRAADLIRTLAVLVPGRAVLLIPGWDCLPYDRASPSRRIMGRRLAVLTALADGRAVPSVVVTTPAALLQRIPPREALAGASLVLKPGDPLSHGEIEGQLRRFGYVFDERVDEPGEAALRGQVLDVFPAGADNPVRIEHRDGTIVALRPFDAASQLAAGECAALRLLPASECFVTDASADGGPAPGSEHRLPEHFSRLDTLPRLLPEAPLVLDIGTEAHISTMFGQIQDAYETRTTLRPERMEGERPLPPERLYVAEPEWMDVLAARSVLRLVARPEDQDLAPPPRFVTDARPFRRFAEFVHREVEQDHRVVMAARTADLRTLTRALDDDLPAPIETASDWAAVERAAPGTVLALPLPVDAGFRDPSSGSVVVAAADVLGSRAHGSSDPVLRPADLAGTELEFRIGDVVVHRDHGLGLLEGLETVEAGEAATDLLRLSYADDATLMVPVDEMDRVWRYGASAGAVTLDRIDGDAWEKRRAKVEAEIAQSAARFVEAAKARAAAKAPKLVPPRAAYERFVTRFPFAETPDQASAIAATLADLASGRPMNRLVCGDVGFGKTEIALRAAAAVALSGRQVAVVAPTTVLARQHVRTFERRFKELGVTIGHLSRLVGPAEAKAVKAGLADGSVRIVIGTHALAGRGIRFADLGLVIIDEEQRFGAAHKEKLKALARDAHVVTLTATPIPRTLQAALVGLQDLSIIATPPAQRQPIRTFVIPFDPATVREALIRERRRGGQSFVVCPRIEDIGPLARQLGELVPELQTFVVHGDMPANEIDDAMVRFADGEGDVLLATNIVESGLDVPRANTMLVWRPDRFGLAQLHQLRGRVGRGRLRGIAYLLTDPAQSLARSTRKRLETLESLDRLGAGFAISARDLDQRGAGDLFGADQAGHVKLIGVSLYQHLLSQALAEANGTRQSDDNRIDINIDAGGHMPETYVPEAEVRINLYAQLARLETESDADAFEEEIRNRFGEPPSPVARLVALARLRAQGRALAVCRIDAGPQAVALTFAELREPEWIEAAVARSNGALGWRNGRLVWKHAAEAPEERLAAAAKLCGFLAKVERSRSPREREILPAI